MKKVIVTEGIEAGRVVERVADYYLDLQQMKLTPCCGCFSCWLRTPGHCVSRELDAFYRAFIHADQVIFFAKSHQGFVSSQLKALFERMCPLYLPYISVKKELCGHVPRYDHYPDVVFYYEGDFVSKEEKDVFENYIRRTFDQFYCPLILLEQIDNSSNKKEVNN